VRTEKWWHNGLYEVIAYAVIEDPLEPTVFHCELRIPEAQYEIRKNFIYYPGEYNTYTQLLPISGLAAKVFSEESRTMDHKLKRLSRKVAALSASKRALADFLQHSLQLIMRRL